MTRTVDRRLTMTTQVPEEPKPCSLVVVDSRREWQTTREQDWAVKCNLTTKWFHRNGVNAMRYEMNATTIDAWKIGFEVDRCRPTDVTSDVLSIAVPFTTPELTRSALRHTGICTDLDVHVSLVDVQVVPFPCPLDQPPIDKKFSERRLQELIKESRVPGQATVLYTRNLLDGFLRALEPKALVVMATKKHWWPTREEKLARDLSKAGHQVMLLRV